MSKSFGQLVAWCSKPEVILRKSCPWARFGKESARFAGRLLLDIYGKPGSPVIIVATFYQSKAFELKGNLVVGVGFFKRRIRQCMNIGQGLAWWNSDEREALKPSVGKGTYLSQTLIGMYIAWGLYGEGGIRVALMDLPILGGAPTREQPESAIGLLVLHSWLEDASDPFDSLALSRLGSLESRYEDRSVAVAEYRARIDAHAALLSKYFEQIGDL